MRNTIELVDSVFGRFNTNAVPPKGPNYGNWILGTLGVIVLGLMVAGYIMEEREKSHTQQRAPENNNNYRHSFYR